MSVFLQIFLHSLSLVAIAVVGLYFFSFRARINNMINYGGDFRRNLFDNSPENSETIKMHKWLNSMKKRSLPRPLTEELRPRDISEIVGQSEAIDQLRTAICCERPMHVLIYGPPGVGKTSAARLLFDMAKNQNGVFEGEFIEIDGTHQRSDERAIADPLIGSVHDPIYQGANTKLAAKAIPEPKPGAVTNAHGGILFIDEIGELKLENMTKLLKVLEDRKVFLTSAYYDPNNRFIPEYIKDIFENGLPADFRLVGATTRDPNEINPALRSRCIEIKFRSLTKEEMKIVAQNAFEKLRVKVDEEIINEIVNCSKNPRDVVNLINLVVGYKQTHDDKIPVGKVSAFKKSFEGKIGFGA